MCTPYSKTTHDHKYWCIISIATCTFFSSFFFERRSMQKRSDIHMKRHTPAQYQVTRGTALPANPVIQILRQASHTWDDLDRKETYAPILTSDLAQPILYLKLISPDLQPPTRLTPFDLHTSTYLRPSPNLSANSTFFAFHTFVFITEDGQS